MLQHIFSVLKSGAFFVLDIPDSEWLRSNMKERSWEWIDGRDNEELTNDYRAANTFGTKLLVCRERELNAAKDTLACREIIIDLAKGVTKDNFYSFRLYKRGELSQVLTQSGFAVHSGGLLRKTQSDRDQDLGGVKQRHLVLAQKPDFGAIHPALQDTDVYFVHPALKTSTVSQKGRRVLATEDISAGTVLFAAKPYAVAPSVDPCRGNYFICSNYACSKRIEKPTAGLVTCSCIEDVVWCDANCRSLDEERHEFECAWLQKFSDEVISKYGTYDFNLLWINVRILCQRQVELRHAGEADISPKFETVIAEDELRAAGANSWDSILALRANQDQFPATRLAHWALLTEAYLQREPFANGVTAPEIEQLICKEETNSFCMYPKATGTYPRPAGGGGRRGVPYGLALHTGGSFFNHSCVPNVMHGPDHVSRMVMRATRAIAAGEECCIAYFDLVERSSLASRRELLARFFNFTCDCERCQWEVGLQAQ